METQAEQKPWLRLLVVSSMVLAFSLWLLQFETPAMSSSYAAALDATLLVGLGGGLFYVGRLIGLVLAEPDDI